jgi:ferredoxin
LKVTIDRDGCIGCGLCAATCPEVFRIAGDGLSEVYSSPSEKTADKVNEAAENCPVSVIKVEN